MKQYTELHPDQYRQLSFQERIGLSWCVCIARYRDIDLPTKGLRYEWNKTLENMEQIHSLYTKEQE